MDTDIETVDCETPSDNESSNKLMIGIALGAIGAGTAIYANRRIVRRKVNQTLARLATMKDREAKPAE
jgi:hypothetical protein